MQRIVPFWQLARELYPFGSLTLDGFVAFWLKEASPMYLRMILWIPALAYFGFLQTIGNGVASPGMIMTTGFLGALLGLLVAAMFTFRECRRENRAKRRA